MSPLSSSSGEDDEYFQYNYPYSAKMKRKTKPSLFLAMCQMYIVTFVTAGFLKLINDLLNFVGSQIKVRPLFFSSRPILLQSCTQVIDQVHKEPCILFVSAITQSLVLQHYFHHCCT